jgi:hypothetical protein
MPIRTGDEDKLRGLANAAVARAKHEGRRRGSEGPTDPVDPPLRPLPPPVIVEAARIQEPAVTYAPPGVVDIHESARIQSNVHIKNVVPGGEGGGGGGTLILEEGARLKINAHIDTLVGSPAGGTMILEKGARVEINAHIGTLVAGADGGTLIVGENASYRLNFHADVATTGGTVVIPDGVSVKANVHAGLASAVLRSTPANPASELPRIEAPAIETPATEAPASDPLPEAIRVKTRLKAKDEDADDPLRELRDVRWRLMRDIVAMADKQREKIAEDDRRPHGKALGHLHRNRDQ